MSKFKLYHEDAYLGEVERESMDDFNSTRWETDVEEVLNELNLDIREFEHLDAFHLEETENFVLYYTRIRIIDNNGHGKFSNYGQLTKKNIKDIIDDFNYRKEAFTVNIDNKEYDSKMIKEFLSK